MPCASHERLTITQEIDMRALALALLSLATVTTTLAGTTVPRTHAKLEIEVIDRQSGTVLPVYWRRGERYLAGEPGREYEIRLHNRSAQRLLTVTSVDGVNVITGQSASTQQSGYVLDAHDSVQIDGWRKNLAEVAAFYFTSLPDSYAARTGRPGNVGVIGVAVFREAERQHLSGITDHNEAAPSSSAPSSAAARDSAAEKLGTGHGTRRDSYAQSVEFERASDEPEAVIRIFYDSRRNLVAQGVIREPSPLPHRPQPFPVAGFVPNP